MALSIYLLVTAFGPLVIGPLSEVYGRKPILHGSNFWFLVWNIVCGFAKSKEMLITAPFLAGFGASANYALAKGVLGDVCRPEQRGRLLGVYLLIPLLFAAMSWATSVFQAVMILVSFSLFHETYTPLILRKRAERLRHDTGDLQYETADERLRANRFSSMVLGRALIRPLRLLVFHSIIQITSVLSAFYYGILYIVLSTFSDLWIDQYKQSIDLSGLRYIACALGEVIGSQIEATFMVLSYWRMRSRLNGEPAPESRIPLVLPGSVLRLSSLFLYEWAAEKRLHWAVVDVGIFLNMLGMQINGMPPQACVMEAYSDHISSAMAATQLMCGLTAFLFPLFGPRMYQVFGYGWGNRTIAFIGLAFSIPAPLVIMVFGVKLRAKVQSSY
ncbi:hypothetical protein NUU61_001810 [Penicillium alfredii]|uniref:Major facilitator superfamily (MFS) profile domain-containing protein n=1 Tax=Penicillium alfredii TaxID=1506179 RepID=A0A9W9FQJ2_9EURO|nr:uncharacterized protein NUU61_001810 [Penicillium alfredii]KAJ5104463.1 hypothetical protein NUU61_001810 [Penicillium alfredii]